MPSPCPCSWDASKMSRGRRLNRVARIKAWCCTQPRHDWRSMYPALFAFSTFDGLCQWRAPNARKRCVYCVWEMRRGDRWRKHGLIDRVRVPPWAIDTPQPAVKFAQPAPVTRRFDGFVLGKKTPQPHQLDPQTIRWLPRWWPSLQNISQMNLAYESSCDAIDWESLSFRAVLHSGFKIGASVISGWAVIDFCIIFLFHSAPSVRQENRCWFKLFGFETLCPWLDF